MKSTASISVYGILDELVAIGVLDWLRTSKKHDLAKKISESMARRTTRETTRETSASRRDHETEKEAMAAVGAMSPGEAAHFINVDIRCIRAAIKSGELKATVISPRVRRITQVDLNAWLESKRKGPAQ